MTDATLPQIFLARHGETEWSLSGRHTGRADVPLTEHGRHNARNLGARLAGRTFARAFTSPSVRARQTCELAGFGDVAVADEDLHEWDYGRYEGLTSRQIRESAPDWLLWRDGCPGGESVAQVGARADRVVARLRASATGDTLVFSSGHFLRVLAARWIGLDASRGIALVLGTGSLSVLGYEHRLAWPAILLWNETSHVAPRGAAAGRS